LSQTNRKFVGCEKNTSYYEKSLERIEGHKGLHDLL